MGAFGEGIGAYVAAGWLCPMPVPVESKFPPPTGVTGDAGRDPDHAQILEWAGQLGNHSIALRMPGGVIGIDVDHYDKAVPQPDGSVKVVEKRGADTIAKLEADWGDLPPTWSSTARGSAEGPGPSRIMLFRVPAGRYVSKLVDCEIIQRHHRYAVVWPSWHDLGGQYTWYDPYDVPQARPPRPDELAELPHRWIAGLAEGAAGASPVSAAPSAGQALLGELAADQRPECAEIANARRIALAELTAADQGSRHDTMTKRAHQLVMMSAAGHSGVVGAFDALRALWAEITAGEDREAEFLDMLSTSARKAVTAYGPHQVPRDPCVMDRGFTIPSAAPADNRPDDPDNEALAVEPVTRRWWSIREVIGAEPFEPKSGLDQPLARDVLTRLHPAMRYAYDSGDWLLRLPDRWETHGDMTGWAVAELAWLMPLGDTDKEAPDEAKHLAAMRARFMSQKGAGGIAGTIKRLVAGGMHPAAVALASLDADPDVLWAGGVPWDLRASAERLTPSRLDLDTPHLHTAAYAPQNVPTPLWDAFLEAVWPDPELRAWAMRVLSIAFTGYSDRAMPILLGNAGAGKTQVINLLMSVLGSYAHAANPKLLTAKMEHDHIVYALRGRRLSFIDEAPREDKPGQERLKQLTGGGELTANQMYSKAVTFRPTHTLVLTANPEGTPNLTDPAVRSRTRLIPCEGDPELVRQTRAAIGHPSAKAWRAEAPGVLYKMLLESGKWLADTTSASTLAAPAGVRYMAEDISAEQDPVSRWVADETEPSEEGTQSSTLYGLFREFCKRIGIRMDLVPTETRWGRDLTRLGYPGDRAREGGRQHRTRPLRMRSHGGSWTLPPGPVTGSQATPDRNTTFSDSSGASEPTRLTEETLRNPGSDLRRVGDGFVTGSNTNPSQVKPQVNPVISSSVTGVTGLNTTTSSHAQARTHPGQPKSFGGVNPSHPSQAPPLPGLEPDLTKAEKAAQRKALRDAEKAAAKAGKLALLAGPEIRLPALVTRDQTVIPLETAAADQLLSTITSTGQALTVDVEHSGYALNDQDYVLRTVQLGRPEFAVVLDRDDPEHRAMITKHLAAAARLHAHSATADLVPLATDGLVDWDSAWSRMYDTAIPYKLADPRASENDAAVGLKQLSSSVLGKAGVSKTADKARAELFKASGWLTDTEATTPVERSGWAQVSKTCLTQVRYAASDVLDTAALAECAPEIPEHLMIRERTVQRMTARVAYTGFKLDGEHVDRLRETHLTSKAELGAQIQAYGIDNPGAALQVATKLTELGVRLPRTAPSNKHPSGQPSVAKGALEPHKGAEGPAGDLIKLVLQYRHHSTALSLFLEAFSRAVHRGDGRLRSTIYTLGTDTGRMSSTRFNMQQLSKQGGIRACVVADEGYKLISADFSSVEIRVAAALSGDLALIQQLAEGLDPHAMAAEIVFGPGFTKVQRYQVKSGVFGRIYGGGVTTLAAQMGVEEWVAQKLIDAIDTLWPQLAQWSRDVRAQAQAGQTMWPAYNGRVIHFPPDRAYAAPNYCIQGTARELLVDGLMQWAQTRWADCTLLPVHDELLVMVPEHEAEEATTELVRCMTTELYGIAIKVEPSEPADAWQDAA
jgi:P4 family phage/plasmid primase-like protien